MDRSEDLININVNICDRPYRLKIKPEEEEFVRKAAKTINQKVKELQGEYAAKDKQDYLAMTALQQKVETLSAGSRFGIENRSLVERIDQLDSNLDKVLSSS